MKTHFLVFGFAAILTAQLANASEFELGDNSYGGRDLRKRRNKRKPLDLEDFLGATFLHGNGFCSNVRVGGVCNAAAPCKLMECLTNCHVWNECVGINYDIPTDACYTIVEFDAQRALAPDNNRRCYELDYRVNGPLKTNLYDYKEVGEGYCRDKHNDIPQATTVCHSGNPCTLPECMAKCTNNKWCKGVEYSVSQGVNTGTCRLQKEKPKNLAASSGTRCYYHDHDETVLKSLYKYPMTGRCIHGRGTSRMVCNGRHFCSQEECLDKCSDSTHCFGATHNPSTGSCELHDSYVPAANALEDPDALCYVRNF